VKGGAGCGTPVTQHPLAVHACRWNILQAIKAMGSGLQTKEEQKG
jgi:hypothetical protein